MDYVTDNPDIFPPDKMKDLLAFVEPEQFPEFTELLCKRGYSEQIIQGILEEFFESCKSCMEVIQHRNRLLSQ